MLSYKNIWNLSFPITLNMIAQNLIVVTDTVFLSHVGEVELGAAAIGGLFYYSLYIIGLGFSNGTQIIIGRRNGESNFKEIGTYFDHGLLFLFALGVIIVSLSRLFTPEILRIMVSSNKIYSTCLDYLDIRIIGLLFAFLYTGFNSLFIGITNTRYLTFNAILITVINGVLAYVMIFGKLGLEPMGIKGAAIASVISEASSFLFLVVITLLKIDYNKYNLFRFAGLKLSVIMNILEISVFIMIQYFLSLAGWFAFFLIIEKTGERPLAISNIIRSLYIFLTIPVWSLGAATSTTVSNLIGQGNKHLVLKGIYKITWISLISITVITLVTLLSSRWMISLYTTDASLVSETLKSLHVVLGVFILFSFTMILFFGVAGTANTRIVLLIELFSLTTYLAMVYILAFQFKAPTHILWTSEYVYFLIIGILSFIYLHYGNWKAKVI